MNNIAHYCFWVERSLSSWERFLGENLWDVNEVVKTLVNLLREKLETQLQVHGGYLAGLDTLVERPVKGLAFFALSLFFVNKSYRNQFFGSELGLIIFDSPAKFNSNLG